MADAPKSEPAPVKPERAGGPAKEWEHRELYDRVKDALIALPWEFDTDINIVGIRVTDLHTFNTALGAAIEQSVVENLNKLRPVWDPDDKYRMYRFVRQAQVFPDVLFQKVDPASPEIIMGIELKGWFAMAKEGEPSFRYTVNPDACAPQDLLVVYPWILREVISGSPLLLSPFVEEARYAAETRNHYWANKGGTGEVVEIIEATVRTPYSSKKSKFNDKAKVDSGNFGRVSRGGIMTDFIEKIMAEPVSGIPLGAWQKFVKIFSEGQTTENIEKRIARLATKFPADSQSEYARMINAILDTLDGLSDETPPT